MRDKIEWFLIGVLRRLMTVPLVRRPLAKWLASKHCSMSIFSFPAYWMQGDIGDVLGFDYCEYCHCMIDGKNDHTGYCEDKRREAEMKAEMDLTAEREYYEELRREEENAILSSDEFQEYLAEKYQDYDDFGR